MKKYILAFFITLGVYVTIYLVSYFLFNQRIAQIQTIESNISQNILESEIQYSLLSDISCDSSNSADIGFVKEINSLASRLDLMEQQRGSGDSEVTSLKKYYSLLEIKDYLLLKQHAQQCGKKPLTILYFYSNKGDCPECTKMGYVLMSMRQDYENLHVYAFDYNLDLSTIGTLKFIYKLSDKVPIIVINRKPYYGFKARNEIEALMPELKAKPTKL